MGECSWPCSGCSADKSNLRAACSNSLREARANSIFSVVPLHTHGASLLPLPPLRSRLHQHLPLPELPPHPPFFLSYNSQSPYCRFAADYTNTFRCLSSIGSEPGSEEADGSLPSVLAEVLGPLDEVRREKLLAGHSCVGHSCTICLFCEFVCSCLMRACCVPAAGTHVHDGSNASRGGLFHAGPYRRVAPVAGAVPRQAGGRGPAPCGACRHAGGQPAWAFCVWNIVAGRIVG